MKPLVCIIILNWNGEHISIQCVDSILKYTNYNNFQIIFVDNGSTDNSVETIRAKFPNITVISLKRNFGFSKGMNVGAWLALKSYKPKYIIFLNNDIMVPKDQQRWLTTLIEDLEEDPKAAVATPKIKLHNGKVMYRGAYLSKGMLHMKFIMKHLKPTKSRKKCYVEHGAGSCILIASKVLQKIGLFDEKFFPFLCEESDLFCRLKKAGYKVIYNPTCCLKDEMSVSLKKYRAQKGYLQYNTIAGKNFVRYAYKNYAFHRFIFTLFIACIRQIIDKDYNRLVLVSLNPFSILRLIRQLDLEKEKIHLSEREVMNRINKIYETRG